MEENLDSPQQDGQPNAELDPAESRYMCQEETQPAENSSSQYGWLQMRGQEWISAFGIVTLHYGWK